MMTVSGKKLAYSGALLLLLLPMLLGAIASSETGTRWFIRHLVELNRPELSIATIEGTLLKHLTLKKLRYRSAAEQAELDTLTLNWEPAALLTGSLHIRSIAASGLTLETLVESEPNSDEITLNLPDIPINIFIDRIDLQQLRYKNKTSENVVERLSLTATLQQQKLRLTRLLLQRHNLKVQGQSEIELTAKLPINARLEWFLRLPQNPEITGVSTLQGDLETLILTGSLGGALVLDHNLAIKSPMQQPSFELSAHWRKLQWPLGGAAQISSKAGSLNLSGTFADYRITLDTQLAAAQLPPFTLTVNARGDSEALTIDALKLMPKQGQLNLSGRVAWMDAVTFDLALAAQTINPGDFIADLPGSLNLQAQTSGQWSAGHILGTLAIQELTGELQGYPVKAQGKLTLNDKQLIVDDLLLQSAQNRMTAKGELDRQKVQLRAAIDAPDLASIWPGLSGSIQGQGSLHGTYKNPVIIANLAAHRLKFQDYGTQQLQLTIDYAAQRAEPSVLNLESQGVQITGQTIERLALNTSGTINRHRIQIQGHSSNGKLSLDMMGAFKNKRWDGIIKELTVKHPQLQHWALAQPWPIAVYQQADTIAIDLPNSCLLQKAAAVCLKVNGSSHDLQAHAHASGLELALLKPWLPAELSLTGTLSAEANISQKGTALNAHLQAYLPKAQVKIDRPQQGPLTIALAKAQLDTDYRQERLTALLRIGLSTSDFVNADIKLGPQHNQTPRSLSGHLQAAITDLSFLDALIPEVEQLKGQFNADWQLTGNINRPIAQGMCRLTNASVNIPLAGISLNSINVQMTGDHQQPERFSLTGQVKSGQGSVALNGSFDLAEDRGFPVRLELEGTHFEVAKLPQAEITMSPHITISQQHDQTRINGDISIDKAHIKLVEIPDTATAPSEDEVIVGTKTGEKPQPLPLLSDITIMLGEAVHFSGYGLITRLTGKLRYTSAAKQQRMQGRVAMNKSTYKAYGQELELTKGEFLFNGPTDNPWLTIEASRKAVSDDVTAILKVTGPLKAPETKVSTQPALPESEALAYLLTGRSLQQVQQAQSGALAKAAFSYGAGQLSWLSDQMGIDEFAVEEAEHLENSAVRLGKYITPDSYIGLSLGFFSNNYAVLFKQQLTQYFSLQTRAGETQRIDLKYQMDTD